jgi:hypothetical protein
MDAAASWRWITQPHLSCVHVQGAAVRALLVQLVSNPALLPLAAVAAMLVHGVLLAPLTVALKWALAGRVRPGCHRCCFA